jgi:hypothetical protein
MVVGVSVVAVFSLHFPLFSLTFFLNSLPIWIVRYRKSQNLGDKLKKRFWPAGPCANIVVNIVVKEHDDPSNT